jgi:hypothetical protein
MFKWNFKSFVALCLFASFTGMKDGKGSWNLSERRPKVDTTMADMGLT